MKTSFLSVLFLSLTIIMPSCKKNDGFDCEPTTINNQNFHESSTHNFNKNNEPESYDSLPARYYLNSVLVSQNELNLNDSSIFICIVIDENLRTFYGFTSDSLYLSWAQNNAYQIYDALLKAKHLNEYADSVGAIEHYERTGEILSDYLEYEEAYVNKNRALGSWYQGYTTTGPNFPVIRWPAFGGNWNNNISAVAYIGAITIYYDYPFYKTHLRTVWHITGNFYVHFWGHYVDNRTSSAFVS
jgi:hypothetical protein